MLLPEEGSLSFGVGRDRQSSRSPGPLPECAISVGRPTACAISSGLGRTIKPGGRSSSSSTGRRARTELLRLICADLAGTSMAAFVARMCRSRRGHRQRRRRMLTGKIALVTGAARGIGLSLIHI